ncbi:hypothetical protein [Endozoicomonas lisbonensis]|uniref:Uncharacterized protein n=1 Tax=Endozoicomonas lisbonensis TaxID=3120522 RepID=A0ABV2SD93_9GAMM
MYIVSKYHDYYDSAIAYGIDKTIVYKREFEKIENTSNFSVSHPIQRLLDNFENATSPWELERGWRHNDPELRFALIGFCGKLYPSYCYHLPADPLISRVRPKSATAWSTKSLFALKQSIFDSDKRFTRKAAEKGDAVFEGERHKGYFISRRLTRKLMEQMEQSQGIPDDEPFRQWGVPVFALIKGRFDDFVLFKNPSLMQLGFQTRVDPYTAHQSIAQYLSGVLGVGEKSTITVDDSSLLFAKGFNQRSFKKEPTKRKH